MSTGTASVNILIAALGGEGGGVLADWIVTSGEYGVSDGVGMDDAWPFGRSQRAMPILQGGKTPDGLPSFDRP